MCARYVITTAPQAIRQWFAIHGTLPNFPPHYNAAPGQDLPVIRRHPESGNRVLTLLRWGLIPYWSDDPKIAWRCINARGETVKTTRAFRGAYGARRCLVPADAFFEWKANGKTKQPYAIALKGREPFAFAALWENWKDPKTSDWLRTFTILTTKPNELVAPLHDRMPVILEPESYDRWLGNDPDPADLIRPYPAEHMVKWPISTRVNKAENDDAAILDGVELSM
jgi:putative SOS response-associated peptidase YedK